MIDVRSRTRAWTYLGSELTLKFKDVHEECRRREWSDDHKARIIAESCEVGVRVCSMARLHGLSRLTIQPA
ncbi:transposase [Rhizobium pisi]